ncbi:MAG: GNAT family N-acetyltransferase [Actinomycetota bacterium]
MRVERVGEPAVFLGRVAQHLLRDEARHNLHFGICDSLIEHQGAYAEFSLWLVEDDGEPVAAALMTPPYNLVVTQPTAEGALGLLARTLHDEGVALPGVTGAVPEVQEFVGAWEKVSGARGHQRMAQRIYQLTSVREIPGVNGGMRPATGQDRDLLRLWVSAFTKEALDDEDDERTARTLDLRLGDGGGGLFLWEDGRPVSLAGHAGQTPNGVRVGPVYTPPEDRRRGYATALVAALSVRLLDEGNRFCFLYTDLANPTSNSIYQVIGYEPICDSAEYVFEDAG